MARSEDQKAEVLGILAANGGNILKTSRETGVPQATIRKWRDGEHVNSAVAEKCEHVKASLADRIESLLQVVVGELEQKASTAKFSELAFGMEKAHRVLQLLRGDPTSIERTQAELSPEERAQRVRDLLDRGRDRAGESLPLSVRANGTGPAPNGRHAPN